MLFVGTRQGICLLFICCCNHILRLVAVFALWRLSNLRGKVIYCGKLMRVWAKAYCKCMRGRELLNCRRRHSTIPAKSNGSNSKERERSLLIAIS